MYGEENVKQNKKYRGIRQNVQKNWFAKILMTGKKIIYGGVTTVLWLLLTLFLLLFLLLLILIPVGEYMDKRREKFMAEAEYVVVIVSKTEDGVYQVKKEMTEASSGDWDYSRKRQTIVWDDNENIVEKSVVTGEEKIFAIQGLEEMKDTYLKEEYGENEEIVEKIRHYLLGDVRYLPNDYDLSFTIGEHLYIWNRDKNQVEKVDIPLEPSDYGPMRCWWMEDGDLMFIYKDFSKRGNALARWCREEGKIEDIGYNMEVFLLDEEKEVLYGIQEEIFYNEYIGYYNNFKLIEKSWETKEERVIIEKYTSDMTNRLAMGEDKLFYVNDKMWATKHEIMCVDIETGARECIYSTKNYVVGILVQ